MNELKVLIEYIGIKKILIYFFVINIIGIIIIVAIVMLILYISGRIGNTNSKQEIYESYNNMFTNSELKSVDKNEDYKSNKKIMDTDYLIPNKRKIIGN